MNRRGVRQRRSSSQMQTASSKMASVMETIVPTSKIGSALTSIGSAFKETAESSSTAKNPSQRRPS